MGPGHVFTEPDSKMSNFCLSVHNFATRLKLDKKTVDRQTEIRHLGVWLREDMSWEKNISEICKKAYSRVKMLSKLKYVGTKKKDLILLYCLHIRSITEYCS